MAVRLLDHFKSVVAVMSATEEELMNVQGLGQKKSREIKEVLSL
jgi:Fanconi anemia group M protein